MVFSSLPNGAHSAIQPFTLETPQEVLDELRTLVRSSRLAVPTFENSQKDGKYGVDREWMQTIKEKWSHFDWRETERRLNAFPHFKANIEDDDGTKYDIHFVALFSQKTDALPLMILHGWPGSFLEFVPILQLLKDKYTAETLPYHVVIPSLPGYTFSSGPRVNEDFGVQDAGRILDRLMSMLGFGDRYLVQGGDVGSYIARYMAIACPSCIAVHVNLLIVPEAPVGSSDDDLTTNEKAGLVRGMEFIKFGLGYAIEHATKPSTIGFVLASSPIALMAWIGEKFALWSDVTPSDETIIEFVTLYWITNTIERCIYTYRQDLPEGLASLAPFLAGAKADQSATAEKSEQIASTSFGPEYVEKPLGFSSFAKELAPTPKSWAASQGNMVFYRWHDQGGHFAALERPEVLLQDVEEFIAQVWKK